MDCPKHMEFKYEFLSSEGSFFCFLGVFFLTTINKIYFLEQF